MFFVWVDMWMDQLDFDDALSKAFDKPAETYEPTPKKKGKKRKEGPDMKEARPKEKKPKEPPGENDEAKREEVYNTIGRYIDMFPNETLGVTVNDKMPLGDLQLALNVIQKKVGQKQEMDILRSGLISGTLAVEQLSQLVPRCPVKLRGLSARVSGNIAMFDTALKQLMCKYGGKFEISPETTLMITLGRLCAQTHMQNVVQDGAFFPPPRVSESPPPIPPPIPPKEPSPPREPPLPPIKEDDAKEVCVDE